MATQPFPVTQQFRDEVEQARERRRDSGQEETAEQREALRITEKDTLTHEEVLRVASAFSMSADRLLELTNDVRQAGATGGPGT